MQLHEPTIGASMGVLEKPLRRRRDRQSLDFPAALAAFHRAFAAAEILARAAADIFRLPRVTPFTLAQRAF